VLIDTNDKDRGKVSDATSSRWEAKAFQGASLIIPSPLKKKVHVEEDVASRKLSETWNTCKAKGR